MRTEFLIGESTVSENNWRDAYPNCQYYSETKYVVTNKLILKNRIRSELCTGFIGS